MPWEGAEEKKQKQGRSWRIFWLGTTCASSIAGGYPNQCCHSEKGEQEDRSRGEEGRVTLKRSGILEWVEKGQSKEETTGRGRWAERTGGLTRNVEKEQEEIIP